MNALHGMMFGALAGSGLSLSVSLIMVRKGFQTLYAVPLDVVGGACLGAIIGGALAGAFALIPV